MCDDNTLMPQRRRSLPELPPTAFAKEDGGDDADFYVPVRLVTHIDEAPTQALTAYYRANLPVGGVLLDLMSSWVSHLPGELAFTGVIGHGMNAKELSLNPRLSRIFVQDLNRNAILPLENESCDAAMCCVGVQYLQQPLEVRPGFSNPTVRSPVYRQLLQPLLPVQSGGDLSMLADMQPW